MVYSDSDKILLMQMMAYREYVLSNVFITKFYVFCTTFWYRKISLTQIDLLCVNYNKN